MSISSIDRYKVSSVYESAKSVDKPKLFGIAPLYSTSPQVIVHDVFESFYLKFPIVEMSSPAVRTRQLNFTAELAQIKRTAQGSAFDGLKTTI
jgi:hypothetical protein